MAYYENALNNANDVGKTSMFNAGLLQTKRIGDLQERINTVSLNPLAWNQEYQVYNYEVWLTCVDSLLQEVSAKLGDKERLQGEFVRDKIYFFLEVNPVYKSKKKLGSKTSTETKLNKSAWKVLFKALTIYEKLIRKFLDDHSFGAPENSTKKYSLTKDL